MIHRKPFKKFDLLAQEYENSRGLLIAARKQEMESILPGFYTKCMGQKIKSPDYMDRSMFSIADSHNNIIRR